MRRRPLKYFIKDKPLARNKEGWRTICEVQRQIYRLIERKIEPTNKETATLLKSLVEESYDLGKRMDRALRDYKPNYLEVVTEPINPNDTDDMVPNAD